MKKLALAALVLLPIALSGCATQSSAPSTTPTEMKADANEAACHDYGEATAVAGDLIVNGSDEIGQEAWQSGLDGLADQFDKVAVTAHGQIATRMNDTVENFPTPINRIMSAPDQYIADVKRVQNACDTAGFPTDNFVLLTHGG